MIIKYLGNNVVEDNRLIKVLADLVAFESVTPNSAGSLEYIECFVTKLGAGCVYVNRNQTSNLIVTIGNGDRILAFAGHVDVVPPGDSAKWINGNPYQLHVDGDLIIGRGVADMKGAIAAFLLALEQFVAVTDLSQYKIMLLLTSDEEGSAHDGTILMVDYLKQNQIQLNYCLVGEPSCVDVIGDTIKVGRRGSLTGSLVVNGKQGHIAYPHLCDNPIHSFAPAMSELSSKIWDNGNEFFPASSLQFANISSGLGVTNVIPGQLTTNFNFRYNTNHSVDSLKQEVLAILNKYKLNYDLSWQHSANPFLTKVGSLIELSRQAINQVCGVNVACKTDGGTSDGRFLIEVSDEIIEFGLRNASIHQLNEATSVSDLTKLASIYSILLCKIFND
ncbi:MAG: succinyl-diaminopimelate desuccinylase [Burkholderiales bacterium]|nr:succinyl-diaminopimelate desuccinylase [Burkholderiales bacterium]